MPGPFSGKNTDNPTVFTKLAGNLSACKQVADFRKVKFLLMAKLGKWLSKTKFPKLFNILKPANYILQITE